MPDEAIAERDISSSRNEAFSQKAKMATRDNDDYRRTSRAAGFRCSTAGHMMLHTRILGNSIFLDMRQDAGVMTMRRKE